MHVFSRLTLNDSLLIIAAFLLIVSYGIIGPLKSCVFASLACPSHLPFASLFVLIVHLPMLWVHNKIVNRCSLKKLPIIYISFYGAVGLLFGSLLSRDYHGFSYVCGWAFYVFGDCYNFFTLTTFWSFTHMITSPIKAKRLYPLLICAGNIGSIAGSGISWVLLELAPKNSKLPMALLTGLASFSLFIAATLLACITVNTLASPHKQPKDPAQKATPTLPFILRQPYLLGILGLGLCSGIVSRFIEYLTISSAAHTFHGSLGQMSSWMLRCNVSMYSISLLISFAEVKTKLLCRLHQAQRLLILPLFALCSGIFLLTNRSLLTLSISLIIIKSMQNSINYPAEEALYIPLNTHSIFKAKPWIGTCGKYGAKLIGAGLTAFTLQPVLFLSITGFWGLLALLVGKKYTNAVKHSTLIV